VRIHHTVRALPRNLQFKPLGLSPAELRAALHELGYPVG
jgi:hypothetical protein